MKLPRLRAIIPAAAVGVLVAGLVWAQSIGGISVTLGAVLQALTGSSAVGTNTYVLSSNGTNLSWTANGSGGGITALTGDCTASGSGSVAITCTKSSGTAYGTAAFQNTGTSGANLPFLNGTNTWSGAQTFNSGVVLPNNGSINMGTSSKWVENIAITSCVPSSGTCSQTNGSAAAFEITLAGASAATSIVITPGFSAPHAMRCTMDDLTTNTVVASQTGTSTTTATLTFYGRTTGTSTSPGATDEFIGGCFAA